jgi:hypothetical protein
MYRSDVNCPVDATPLEVLSPWTKKANYFGVKARCFVPFTTQGLRKQFRGDSVWKETAGEADGIGLVINIVSGKPLSLFLLQLAMEGTSVYVVTQIWLPYVHGASTSVSSQTTVCCDVRYM